MQSSMGFTNDAVQFAKSAIRWREESVHRWKRSRLIIAVVATVILACIIMIISHHRYLAALSITPPLLILAVTLVYLQHRLKVLRHEINHWKGRLKSLQRFPPRVVSRISEAELAERLKGFFDEGGISEQQGCKKTLQKAGIDPLEMTTNPTCDCGEWSGPSKNGQTCPRCNTVCQIPIPYRPRHL